MSARYRRAPGGGPSGPPTSVPDAREAARRDARRRRSRRRALRFNLALLCALVGLGLLYLRTERLGEMLQGDAGAQAEAAVGALADALRNFDPDAAVSEPVFELRRRIEDRFERCFGFTASSRPVALAAMPGRLALRVEGRQTAPLEMSLAELKATGPAGGWLIVRSVEGIPPVLAQAAAQQAKLAVFTPGAACPKTRG